MVRFKSLLGRRNWESVAVVVTVIGILSSFIIYVLQRDIKSLEIEILTSTSLIEVSDAVAGKVHVLYEDRRVSNLTLIDIRIKNTGNQAILEADYVRPIQVVFPTQSAIVESLIIKSDPSNIGATTQLDQNRVTLSPVLLNESDEIVMRLLVIDLPISDNALPFVVDARIAGVRNISIVSAVEKAPRSIEISLPVTILIVTVVSVLGILIGVYIARRPSNVARMD